MTNRTLISNCDDLTGLTTTGTVTVDNTVYDKNSGVGSFKLVTGSTAYSSSSVSFTGTWDLWDNTIVPSIYLDPTNPPREFTVTVYNGLKYAQWRYALQSIIATGMFWSTGLNKSDAIFYDGFTDTDYSTIDKIKFSFSTYSASAKTGYLNKVELLPLTQNGGVITFRLDDGLTSHYTIVKPILDNYGFKASSFNITNKIGTAGYLTETQLQELYGDGWDVGSHSKTHPYLATITDETDMVTEIKDSYDYLDSQNFTRSKKLLVTPYFSNSNLSMNKIKDYYLMSGCGLGWTAAQIQGLNGGIQSNSYPPSDFMQVAPSQSIPYTINTTLLSSILEDVVKYNEWIIFMVHDVTDANVFEEFIQTIYESGVSVKPFSEVYDEVKPLLKYSSKQLLNRN